MLTCILIGIAVDDTIHFLWAMKKANGISPQEKIQQSYHQTAGALIQTTLLFVVAIPCFLLMELKLFVQIGTLLSLVFIAALLADYPPCGVGLVLTLEMRHSLW